MILLPTEGQLGEIGAMAYDANGTNAVYSSQSTYNYRSEIFSINLLTQQVKLLFDRVDTEVISMDIDCYTGDVYWISYQDSKRLLISVTKGTSSGYKRVLVTGLQHASFITLAPELSLMFIYTGT